MPQGFLEVVSEHPLWSDLCVGPRSLILEIFTITETSPMSVELLGLPFYPCFIVGNLKPERRF